jgi:hypothetical protein
MNRTNIIYETHCRCQRKIYLRRSGTYLREHLNLLTTQAPSQPHKQVTVWVLSMVWAVRPSFIIFISEIMLIILKREQKSVLTG